MSWNDSRNVPYAQKVCFSQISVSEHFSFAKIIHLPDMCGISRSWLNSMIITQVHLVLGTIKKVTLKCAVLSHNTMPQMSQVMRERAIGMVTAGMSTTAVARELNVNISTISRLTYFCVYMLRLYFLFSCVAIEEYFTFKQKWGEWINVHLSSPWLRQLGWYYIFASELLECAALFYFHQGLGKTDKWPNRDARRETEAILDITEEILTGSHQVPEFQPQSDK